MCWSILVKIDGDLTFLKDDRFSSWNAKMAKIYERLLSTNILREKRRDSFDPQRENLLREDSICIAILIKIPRVIVFVFLLHDCLASVFSEEKFCFARRA